VRLLQEERTQLQIRLGRLQAEYNRTGPVTSSIITASFDNDVISFQVLVTTFVQTQNYSYSYVGMVF